VLQNNENEGFKNEALFFSSKAKFTIWYLIGLAVCLFLSFIFQVSTANTLYMLVGYLVPASFNAPDFSQRVASKRYRFSTLRLIYFAHESLQKITRYAHPSTRPFIERHFFSLILALLMAGLTRDGLILFWLVGVALFEALQYLKARKDGKSPIL